MDKVLVDIFPARLVARPQFRARGCQVAGRIVAIKKHSLPPVNKGYSEDNGSQEDDVHFVYSERKNARLSF